MDEEERDGILSGGAGVDEVDLERIEAGDSDRSSELRELVESAFSSAPIKVVLPDMR